MFRSGEIIDERFFILDEVGRGGYGTVFLAEELHPPALFSDAPTSEDATRLRRVAIKVFSHATADDRRFATEIAALCRLEHPHIVPVFSFGRDRFPYLSMRFIDGVALSDTETIQKRFTLHQRVQQLVQIAEALGHAHERGVVHRDLKPHNVLIDRTGHAWVVDFGLAWLLQPGESASRRVGTPGYLAPELIEPTEHAPDHRADIYSFGAMMHAAFTGVSPFRGDGMLSTIRRQLAGEPRLSADLPSALRELILACISVDPARRPRTGYELAETLRHIVQREAIPAPDLHAVSLLEAPDARVDLLHLRVESIEATHHPQRGEGMRLRLSCGLDQEQIGAFIWFDDRSRRAEQNAQSLRLIREGMRVHFLGARVVANSKSQRFIALDANTTPILEPDIPIAVTDVARVQGVKADACARRVLIDWHEPRPFTRHIVEGGIAHDILESLVEGGEDPADRAAFARAFVAGLRRRKIECVAAGLSDEDLTALQERMGLHFRHLSAWVREVPPGGRQAEVQRLSARYGMEGRIDLVLQHKNSVDIVELKTGKYAADEHEQQVRAYGLMWEKAARRREQRLQASLVYSQTGRHRRIDLQDTTAARALLHGRNALIGALYELAFGTPTPANDSALRSPTVPIYNERPALCSDAPCRFRRDQCAAMTRLTVASEAPEVSIQDWYAHFDRLIAREYIAASRAIGSLLSPGTLAQRVHAGRAAEGLTIVLVDEAQGFVHLRCADADLFQPGDDVLLHRNDDEDIAYFARVREVHDHAIELSCHGAASLHEAALDGWVLDHRPARIGFQDAWRGIFNVLRSGRTSLYDALLRPERYRAIPLPPPLPDDGRGLNDEQRLAVAAGLYAEVPVVIQGPPGTGKTAVIADLVARLVAEGKRVLVATNTHSAADNVLARIVLRGVRSVVRVGGSRTDDPLVVDACEQRSIAPDELFLHRIADNAPSLATLHAQLEDTSVFVSTANAALRHPAFEALEHLGERDTPGVLQIFDVAIIDEASQLSEALAAGIAVRAHRIILVGDDRQLPPVVSSPDARSSSTADLAPSLAAIGLGGLDRSLFERLRNNVPSVSLRRQYRMNEGVQTFPSRSFYGGQLIAARGQEGLPLRADVLEELPEEIRRRVDPRRPSVWVDVGEHSDGHINVREAEAVAETAQAMLAAITRSGLSLNHDRVGIITPFRAQARAIRAQLQKELGAQAHWVDVDTVERFQGRERDVILISLATSRWSSFVFDPRRLNVALTRARFKVIVFGATELGQRMMERFVLQASSMSTSRSTIPPEPDAGS